MERDPSTEYSEMTNVGVSREEVEAAIRKLIQWAGDDPDREGLIDTPKRVAKAFQEFFSGYAMDPTDYLARTSRKLTAMTK
ncbi:MAG: GTP cyclohydrolase 1 [Alphaproteobacteria bacterium MarineAlpha4_Bin2]|nr:MAG: GTP cyclohydrolase 1 [Alphaproteobacteria bacterium MarineAlpha4_Bin2]